MHFSYIFGLVAATAVLQSPDQDVKCGVSISNPLKVDDDLLTIMHQRSSPSPIYKSPMAKSSSAALRLRNPCSPSLCTNPSQ